MRVAVTIEISNQLSEVLSVIERHLESTLLAVHLYGSAVDGGLKPYSDIDLLVTVAVKLDETTRRALLNDLMEASAFPGESETLRAIEVTLVVHDDRHCCKVSDEAAFCLIQRPYISKTLLTRRISP
ncbi:nucleotidyltransferase domain-containing protein, partial [Achromobacter ruhlandii]|uniref:nucleotidyltransferase domain-containing protein n=1 Tax=Achromobacter ruhlandii TaxID=72557 RepID=UPI00216651F3